MICAGDLTLRSRLHGPDLLHGHSHSHGDGETGHSHGGAKPKKNDFNNPITFDVMTNEEEETPVQNTSDKTELVVEEKECSSEKPKEQSINIKAALMHVIGDLVQAIGVLLSAIVIYFFPDWKILDPIVTLIFACIVFATTSFVFKSALIDLMEAVPKNMQSNNQLANIYQFIVQQKGIIGCHSMHLWSVTTGKDIFTCHIEINSKLLSYNMQSSMQNAMKPSRHSDSIIKQDSIQRTVSENGEISFFTEGIIVQNLQARLQEKFGFYGITIQPEVINLI